MFEILWGRGQYEFKSSEAFIYIFNSLTFLGTNPPKKRRFLYFIYSALVNLHLVIISPIIFNMGVILGAKELPTTQILTNLQAAINIVGIPFKVIAVTLYINRLRGFNVVAEELDSRYEGPEQRNKIRKSVMTGNRAVMFFTFAYGLYGSMTFISAVVEGRPLFAVYVPFWDWRHSTMEYWLQVSYETMLIFYILYVQLVNDCYPVAYIYVIRTHLQLLAERVKNLATDPKKSKDDNYADLVQCIKDHQLILQLHEILSPVISITVFVQFLIMAVVLGTTMINIFIFADSSSQFASILYLMAVLVQTSPTCYQATHLMDDSDQLPDAIFHSNWVEQDMRYRKMLIFFMQKAQESMPLTAMKIFPITLNTNLSIAKLSFSLYTFIKEMNIGEKYKN